MVKYYIHTFSHKTFLSFAERLNLLSLLSLFIKCHSSSKSKIQFKKRYLFKLERND